MQLCPMLLDNLVTSTILTEFSPLLETSIKQFKPVYQIDATSI